MDSYKEFSLILAELKFEEFYRSEIMGRKSLVNYGPKRKSLEFASISNAGDQYNYDDGLSDLYSGFMKDELFRISDDEKDNLISCIKVFDWGNVQSSNIVKAIGLYDKCGLSDYLRKSKQWFEDDSTLACSLDNALWSAGWTKVYSFCSDLTTIYDSRVAAFINLIVLTFAQDLTESNLEKLKLITSSLTTLPGRNNRVRRVGTVGRKMLGLKKPRVKHEKDDLKANKVASWILRYMAQIESNGVCTQSDFRRIDKAAFMLGFDVSQLGWVDESIRSLFEA